MAIGGNRIYHVNSNCTVLERAAQFYEALGLRRVVRTIPSRAQPGDAFGLAEVAWDAWVLQSDDGLDGLSLDLLEWTTPPPTGTPPPTVGQPGLNRLCVSTPDLDATIDAAVAAGGTLSGGPVFGHGDSGPRTAMLRDPDGVPVQLFEGDAVSIAQVIVNCVDLDASLAYYRDVMGLVPVGEVREIAQPAAIHGLDADGLVRTARLQDSGSRFSVTLVQWLDPVVDPASRAGARRQRARPVPHGLGHRRLRPRRRRRARRRLGAAGAHRHAVGRRRPAAAAGAVLARPQRRVPRAHPDHRPVRRAPD